MLPFRLRWLLLLVAFAVTAPRAQSTSELGLKVRLTLGLARFLQVATSAPDAPLRLCVAHRSAEVSAAFAAAEGRRIEGRRVAVITAASAERGSCDVLFVHATTELSAALAHAAAQPRALTIGDADGFLARGGMVEYVHANDAIRFDVNLTAMESSGVHLSSQALRLARQVRH